MVSVAPGPAIVPLLGAGASKQLGVPTLEDMTGTYNSLGERVVGPNPSDLDTRLENLTHDEYRLLRDVRTYLISQSKELLIEEGGFYRVPVSALVRTIATLARMAEPNGELQRLSDYLDWTRSPERRWYRDIEPLGTAAHSLLYRIEKALVQLADNLLPSKTRLLRPLYDPLVNLICESTPPGGVPAIFTTNYDEVIEKYFEQGRSRVVLNSGFRQAADGSQVWSPEPFYESPPKEGLRVDLYQLHGSISWKRELVEPRRLLKVSDWYEENPGLTYELMFPHHTAYRSLHPYGLYHQRFWEALLQARCCFIIGFRLHPSEADILNYLRYALATNRELHLVIVNPRPETGGATGQHFYLVDPERTDAPQIRERIHTIRDKFELVDGRVPVLEEVRRLGRDLGVFR